MITQQPPVPTIPLRGIPSARNVDHIGITVPDITEAITFFSDILGADLLFRMKEGPGTDNPMDTRKALDVDGRDTLTIAMMRCGPTLNVELMQYHTPRPPRSVPANDDLDVPHLAFYVDDFDAASAYLQAHGCKLLSGPNRSANGPKTGQAIWYFLTPWGMSMELINRPSHMPYEADTAARFYGPAPTWNAKN